VTNAKALYAELSREFATPHKLPKGGASLDYLTGEQVITHLNNTLGVDGWEFTVKDHGRDEDTVWVLGRLVVYFPDRTVAREQFGECQVTRGMSAGDSRKGACTDATKKAASLIGVGLWLYDKDNGQAPAPRPQQRQSPPAGPAPTMHYAPGEPVATPRAAKLRARWSELWGEALALQLDMKTLPKLPERPTEEVLEEKGRELAARVSEAKGRAAGAA
jgi:hypothetical protein